jgi:hypothetical protein
MKERPDCLKCGSELVPVKNGFDHMNQYGHVMTGDLWGCPACHRLEIHGVPPRPAMWWPLYALVQGKIEPDPRYKDGLYQAYRDPEFKFLPNFWDFLETWYPDFFKVWSSIAKRMGFWKREIIDEE